MNRIVGIAALVAYIGCVVGANWAIQRYGLVPVGFGYMAPAGVYFAGVAFTARDFVQDYLGRRFVILAIVAGAALSWFISPTFAAASGVAFLVSETADFVIYTPLRGRHWLGAVALSNTVGLIVDSALFLWLAFGSLAYIQGQIIGKAEMTILAVAAIWLLRKYSPAFAHSTPAAS